MGRRNVNPRVVFTFFQHRMPPPAKGGRDSPPQGPLDLSCAQGRTAPLFFADGLLQLPGGFFEFIQLPLQSLTILLDPGQFPLPSRYRYGQPILASCCF